MAVIQGLRASEEQAPKKQEKLVAKRACKYEVLRVSPKVVASVGGNRNRSRVKRNSLVELLLEPAGCIAVNTERQKRRKIIGLHASGDNKIMPSSAMKQAIEVQATLSPQFPSMIKAMLQSHVTRGFWLGLNSSFCAKHLPQEDTMMILEDEDGLQYQAKYLAGKSGLSGGWRGFSIAHNLLVGDVIVFQLVNPAKFKVYISRANSREEEGALTLLKLDADKKQALTGSTEQNWGFTMKAIKDQDSQMLSGSFEQNRRFTMKAIKDQDSLMLSGGSSEESNSTDDDTTNGSSSDQSEHDNDDLGFDIGDGIRFCESSVDFSEVRSFQHFDILANGLVITCELSKHLQRKYYDLCCSRNCFLHQHLVDGLNVKLIAGIIAETINIADAIRASKLATSQDDFAAWKRTLQGFQTMGMDVGFLIARLDQLMSLTDKSNRLQEAKVERLGAMEELRSLEARTLQVKERLRSLDEEVNRLETGGAELEFMFQEMANASW